MNAVLNDVKEWGQYIPAPSEVNQKWFQGELDRIAGKSPTGYSILRLIWGWDATVFLAGEWRLRYSFHRVELPGDKTVDIAVPRWFIEELVEPAQYRKSWDLSRYTVDGLNLKDELGPAPDHLYVAAHPIGKHDSARICCQALWAESRRRCWGDYKAPGDKELKMVRKAVSMREQIKMHNRPDELPSQRVLDECFELQFQRKSEDAARRKEKVDLAISEFIRVFGGNFTSGDPSRHHHGKYKFLRGSSLSGATPEEIKKYGL